jgi:hypothetical protein
VQHQDPRVRDGVRAILFRQMIVALEHDRERG